MAAPFNASTTETKLSLPFNGSIYTTQREVSASKPMPLIGETMESELGVAWADSLVISSGKAPKGSLHSLQVVHARIPSEAAQLATNWEFSTCDMGGVRFPSVSRTFVLLASAVAHDTPAKGSAMPFVEGDLFDGKGYILVDRQVVRSGMELEPVFRVERRNYMLKSAIIFLGIDSLNGKALSSETTLYYSNETVIPGVTEPQTITVTGTLTPDATSTMNRVEDLDGYPQFSTAIDGETYPATRCYYNGSAWILSHHTGGALIPYALWTSDACTLEDCPSPSDATGWAPLFSVGMASPTGTPVFTDDTNYSAGITASELFADPGNAYWGLQSDGTQHSGQQLSCGWYSITTEMVVAGTFVDGVVDIDSFTSNENFTWPPVLSYFNANPWPRRDGAIDYAPVVKFNPDGYSGPCLTTFTRTWSKIPFNIPKVDQMLPTRINFSPMLYNLNIGECLHGEQVLSVSSGSNHPVYKSVTQTETFPATNYLVWPDTIVAFDDQEPFRGGFLRTRRVVAKPS